MRLWLSLAVFCAAAGIGAAKRAKLWHRAEALGVFAADVRRFRDAAELSPEPIRSIAQKLASPVWRRLVNELDGADLQEAWERACIDSAELSEDSVLIREFSAVLCMHELQAQVNAAEFYLRRLDAVCVEAEAEYAQKGKMYASMGVLTGLALALAAA